MVLILLCLSVPRPVYAHAVGISRGEYERRGDTVTATLHFARPELAGALPELDADRDGSISDGELRAGSRVVDATIVQGITVATAAGRCAGTLQDARLTEEDGLSIRAAYRCQGQSESASIALTFLDRLSHGHRHLAAIGTGAAAARFVAYSGNAAFGIGRSSSPRVQGVGIMAVGLPLLGLGVSHILTGYDHLVFLFGLILVGGRVRSLLLALTAFTVAHSITLGLSALGVWSPSAMFVEPAIALSIAYVGVENWFVANADRRWLITFPFGLIHGFGFAGALQEIALPRPQVPLALAAFNTGVEAGQVALLLLVLPLLMWLRRRQWFADRGVKAMSAAIAVAGVWWFVARI
jgi:hydrogenase/urease accessory protein HupE